MIFYFTGTGNSLYAAKKIAEHNGEKLISVASEVLKDRTEYSYVLGNNESVGFVFPVYAWGPPSIVTKFVKKLKYENYSDNYIFSVITCGAEIGNAANVIKKALKKKGLDLGGSFSVVMPSNYMIMMDLDSEESKAAKLLSAEKTIEHICKAVQNRQYVSEIIKGSLPALKTAIICPLFSKGAIQPQKFFADDNCTGCGICETVCSCSNIRVDGKPKWGNRCTQCLACINYCPVKAIQFGTATQNKGRYTNPNITPDDISAAK